MATTELKVDIPNDETLEAMEEVRWLKAHPEAAKRYTDVDEMMKELLADEV